MEKQTLGLIFNIAGQAARAVYAVGHGFFQMYSAFSGKGSNIAPSTISLTDELMAIVQDVVQLASKIQAREGGQAIPQVFTPRTALEGRHGPK